MTPLHFHNQQNMFVAWAKFFIDHWTEYKHGEAAKAIVSGVRWKHPQYVVEI